MAVTIPSLCTWCRGHGLVGPRIFRSRVPLERCRSGPSLACRIPHAASIGHALLVALEMERFRRNWAAVRDLAERLSLIAAEKGQMMHGAMARFHLVAAKLAGDHEAGAAEEMRAALVAIGDPGTGSGAIAAWGLVNFADSLVRAGRVEECARAVAMAGTQARTSSDKFFLEPEILRLNGKVALRRDRTSGAADAENWFKKALMQSHHSFRKPSRSNCAPPSVSPGSGATGIAGPRPTTFLRQSTTGSRKDTICPI
jgi:hypothetical protein